MSPNATIAVKLTKAPGHRLRASTELTMATGADWPDWTLTSGLRPAARQSQNPGIMKTSHTPDWLVAEMPPGYQTRFAEIQRLSAEMNAMDRMARLLWDSGSSLREAVGEAFAALKYEVEPLADVPALVVKLDPRRRFLVRVADATSVIEKKSPELAHVFRLVQELGGENDRTLLVTSGDPKVPPKARGASVEPDALKLLSRVGANVLPAAMIFAAWSMAQQDPPLARAYMDKVHAMDGGLCTPPKN